MQRSHSMPGALALAASFFVLFATAAAPVHALEPLADARILSAVPFEFRADRDIFSRMPAEPGDSRILKPIDPMRSASESPLQDRSKRKPMI